MLNSFTLDVDRARVADLAAQYQLPAIYTRPDYVEVGGLMSYAVSFNDLYRRSATYVDKILKGSKKGSKPADLPVEQPTRFDLAVNLKAARALGITVPPTVLVQATEVLE